MDVDLNSHCSQAGARPVNGSEQMFTSAIGRRVTTSSAAEVSLARNWGRGNANRSKALRGVIWIARGLWLVDPLTRRRRLMALAVAP